VTQCVANTFLRLDELMSLSLAIAEEVSDEFIEEAELLISPDTQIIFVKKRYCNN